MPTPSTLIMHGGRDQLVPFNQSCRLYATLKALGKDVTFYKLDNACHACYGFRSARALRFGVRLAFRSSVTCCDALLIC